MSTTFIRKISQSENIPKMSLWLVSILLLFFGFYANTWHVAHQEWFDTHQRDTEGLIMGRMVKSRQDGIFSAGGLNGYGTFEKVDQQWITSSQVENQYSAFLNRLSFDEYGTYKSQPGGQGMIFSLLDKLLPLSPALKLKFFYLLTALLSAIALTAIIGWFCEEFNWIVALFVLASAVFSHWLTVFGKNLWWSMWAFYLPMIVVLYYLKQNRDTENRLPIKLGILILISVFIKCFINGFEYITTTLVMMVVPLVYYAILDKWNKDQCFKFAFTVVIGSGVAIFFGLTLLCFQIGAVKGSVSDGIEHVVYSFGKRTHGQAENFDKVYAASLKASTIGVVVAYVKGVFFDFNNYLSTTNIFISKHIMKVRYIYLISLFAITSVLLYFRSSSALTEKRHQNIALIWTTWFAVLAPLSWYVIFKAHSQIHLHMSFLLWQMPFTFFGFALFGALLRRNPRRDYQVA